MPRYILHITIWIFSATITGVLFFNATSFDEATVKILSNIEKIDEKLNNSILSEKAKNVLKGHKTYLMNVLSKRIGLSDCESFRKIAPTMNSGMYMAYHTPNANSFDMIFCDIEKREQILLDKQVSYEPTKPVEVATYVPPRLQPPAVQPSVRPAPEPQPVITVAVPVKTQPTKIKCASDEKASYRKDRNGSLILYCTERRGGDNDR